MNDRVCGIYQIRNRINNKLYIGSSVDIRRRWFYHTRDLLKGKHASLHLQRSWDIYGKNNFAFEIIEIVNDIKLLISREQYWIEKCISFSENNGYNICRFANSTLGRNHSFETRLKMSKLKQGLKITEETRKKMQAAQLGKKHTIESRNKMSIIAKGRKVTEETKAKLSAFFKNKKRQAHTEETKLKLSNIFKGRKGHKHTNETKQKLRELAIKQHQNNKNLGLNTLKIQGNA